MTEHLRKLVIGGTLCVAATLCVLANTSNCKVCTSGLPCYGETTTCTHGGQSGTPSGGGSAYKHCTQGSPGRADCTTSSTATNCVYTCTVNGVEHQHNTTIYQCTGTQGAAC